MFQGLDLDTLPWRSGVLLHKLATCPIVVSTKKAQISTDPEPQEKPPSPIFHSHGDQNLPIETHHNRESVPHSRFIKALTWLLW
jgi:hypothetical protein